MAGRDNIKGSVRNQVESCNENRFLPIRDPRAIGMGHTRVNMSRGLPRDRDSFKDDSPALSYSYNIDILYKRPDRNLM